VLLAVAAAAGCGDRRYDPVPLHRVRGTLLLDGAPLPGAVVRFHPADPGLAAAGLVPAGRTGDDGSFELTTYEDRDGAPAGDFVVTVVLPGPRGKGPPGPPADRFGGRHADPRKSKLRAAVRPGDDALPPLVLPGPAPGDAPAPGGKGGR
jgi:hypothetical protein